ncbi:MAG: thiol peroxidase [Deltaproteobacteria bacterium]|nr:thiol peroxidase [Deltaproteobacteria bacterium]MBW2180041.1 thiol peroxidase [Deltaproteobacteria bacterium]
MAEITLKGTPIHTVGELPFVGDNAMDFSLTRMDLSDMSLKDVAGKRVVLNIFPSVDTSTCAMSVRRFNSEISNYENAVVLCISRDLPFAHARFCGTEGLNDVISLSEMRNRDFGQKYGVEMTDGPLAGLLARAVVVIDESGKVIYTQLVNEIGEEPDYEKALTVLRDTEDLEACTTSTTAEHARGLEDDEPCDDGRSG